MVLILTIVLSTIFGSTFGKIHNEPAYKHFYANEELEKPYALTLTAIVVAEACHLLLLAGFIGEYVHRHKD